LAAAAWTWFIWVFRSIAMLGEDRSTAFVVVHSSLALISIGLAIPVAVVGWRMLRRPGSADREVGQ
jgi:hypothetical protein